MAIQTVLYEEYQQFEHQLCFQGGPFPDNLIFILCSFDTQNRLAVSVQAEALLSNAEGIPNP